MSVGRFPAGADGTLVGALAALEYVHDRGDSDGQVRFRVKIAG